MLFPISVIQPKKASMAMLLAIVGLAGCASSTKCVENFLFATDTFARAEFGTLMSDLRLLGALKTEANDSKLLRAQLMVKQEIVRHLVLVGALKIDLAQLRDAELETLCMIKMNWDEIAYDKSSDASDTLAYRYLSSISDQLIAETNRRQAKSGGGNCNIGGNLGTDRRIIIDPLLSN